MKTALYGGTFNPPHIGHYLTVKTLSGLYDRVIVMPAAIPPHKTMPENSFSAEERLELARLTFGGIDKVEVSDYEIKKDGVCYTIDTINALDADDLTLALGTDMLLSFEKWRGFEEILRRVKLAVVRRDERSISEHIDYLIGCYGANVTVIDTDIVEFSSTQLRGGDMRRVEMLKKIDPKRLEHSLGTECEAVRLADHYGLDARDAALAALLHDCTKYWTVEKHLQYCEQCNIMIDRLFSENDKLLHGVTAAELARREFNVNDDAYTAIRYHTTGRAGMSKPELVIFLADKLEPTREYTDIPEYRALAYRCMERAALAIMDMSIDKLKREGKTIHPSGIEARNYLQKGLGL